MVGREIFHVVESYGTRVRTSEDEDDDTRITSMPYYRARGISFTRSIFRPAAGIDLLTGQVRNEAVMYDFSSVLPIDATENRENLRDFIIEHPPPANRRFIPVEFNNLGWEWNHTATVLAEYVHDNYFESPSLFGVEGDEGFGTVVLMRQDNRWQRETWRLNPPAPLYFTACNICGDPITYTPIEYLLGLQVCQHVFHRSCLLRWVWLHSATPSCPVCRSLI